MNPVEIVCVIGWLFAFAGAALLLRAQWAFNQVARRNAELAERNRELDWIRVNAECDREQLASWKAVAEFHRERHEALRKQARKMLGRKD